MAQHCRLMAMLGRQVSMLSISRSSTLIRTTTLPTPSRTLLLGSSRPASTLLSRVTSDSSPCQTPNASSLPSSKGLSLNVHSSEFADTKTALMSRKMSSAAVSTNEAEVVGPSSSSATKFASSYVEDDGTVYIHPILIQSSRGGNKRKLKPSIVKRRVNKLRTYIGAEKRIRHSPWRLNLVCQFAAGLTVPEALTQLEFCEKSRAPLVSKVIRRTANLADIRDGLQYSQLEVAECFATHGTHLKRLKIMGRGRSGTKRRRHSHMRLVLREIDFELKIAQAKTLNQKKRWAEKRAFAEKEGEEARAEREEIERLEREAEARRLAEEAAKEKK